MAERLTERKQGDSLPRKLCEPDRLPECYINDYPKLMSDRKERTRRWQELTSKDREQVRQYWYESLFNYPAIKKPELREVNCESCGSLFSPDEPTVNDDTVFCDECK